MPTAVIDPDVTLTTLINTFTVDPARQDELVALLDDATEQVMRHQAGFISANIHASLDGTRVVNYAQWTSEEAMNTMLADPVCREHMAGAAAMASFEPLLYRVCSSHR